MIRTKNFCNNCKKFFDKPRFYYERHGLDVPPYERVAVCSRCGSSDFVEFETDISKFEVAERILRVIAFLNKHTADLENLYGTNIKNEEIEQSVGLLSEMMNEMFEYIDIQNKLLKISTNNEVEQILMRLARVF